MRAALFVPATRPERFAKALASGADAVIIDLEDAVEVSLKDQARGHVRAFAREQPGVQFLLRVNAADTPWFEADLALCADCPGLREVLLPKAESTAQVARVAATGRPVLPIVESAAGVLALGELSRSAGVSRLSCGTIDLMLDLGTRPDTPGARDVLQQVRTQLLLHSAAAGLAAPLDGVHPDFSDKQGLAAAATLARDMGFGGMLCIHPAQVPVIQSVFAPDAAELDWARRVVAQADASGSFAFQVDGKMVDAPVIARARQLLAVAPAA